MFDWLLFPRPNLHWVGAAVTPDVIRNSRQCCWDFHGRCRAIKIARPVTAFNADTFSLQRHDSTQQVITGNGTNVR